MTVIVNVISNTGTKVSLPLHYDDDDDGCIGPKHGCHNVPCCHGCFPALSHHFPMLPSLLSFQPLTLGDTLPSATILFSCVQNLLLTWGSKTCLGFSECAVGLLLVLPRHQCFVFCWLSFSDTMLAFYWVYCELGALLSSVAMCNGKVLALMCVCMHAHALLVEKQVSWILSFRFMLQ